MTTREAAEYLELSLDTVWRLIRRESIKAQKFGIVWMVNRKSVEAYKARNEGKGQHDPTRG